MLSGAALSSGFAKITLAYGQYEGRTPSRLYSDAFYLNRYADIAAAVNSKVIPSGFYHYVTYGIAEFRLGAALAPVSGDAQSFFDEWAYRAMNPDVAAAIAAGTITSGWAHFEAYGQFEGRQPSQLFSEQDYLARYPDVRAAVQSGAIPDGFFHYVNYGFAEVGLGCEGCGKHEAARHHGPRSEAL